MLFTCTLHTVCGSCVFSSQQNMCEMLKAPTQYSYCIHSLFIYNQHGIGIYYILFNHKKKEIIL